MSDASFARIVRRQIIECRWPDLSERWLQYLPTIDPPGSAPSEGLSQFIGFTDIADEIGKDFDVSVKREVDGVREYVFREGVFLLHKALHVSGCAENQVKSGYKTWSLPEAYQASLFAVKAILHFCGIALAEHNSKGVLIDIFPKEEDVHKRRRKLKLRLLDDPAIQFTKFNMRFQHGNVWTVFLRLLMVFQMDDVWPTEYTSALAKLDTSEFAKQRNHLNYKNELWIFDDLHELVVDKTFGVYPSDIEKALVYGLKTDFSIGLAVVIIRMAYLLFIDISSNTKLLDKEISLVQTGLTSQLHPLYKVAFP